MRVCQAKKVAQKNGQYVFVDVLDWSEFPTLVRNRDLWSQAEVKALIRDNFVFMQVRVTRCALPTRTSSNPTARPFGPPTQLEKRSPAGQRFLQLYPTDHLPYAAIIDPRTGSSLSQVNVRHRAHWLNAHGGHGHAGIRAGERVHAIYVNPTPADFVADCTCGLGSCGRAHG